MINFNYSFFRLIKKMSNEIIKYFRDGLRKKLKRPNCGRLLSLWDDRIRTNHINNNNIKLDYIKSNEFLLFLYQTKHDLCCVVDKNAQNLSYGIDKFFYLIFEFETYYNIFIFNKMYRNRLEIIDDVIYFYQNNSIPKKLCYQYRYVELFKDLLKKIDKWNHWKRVIIINYTRIILTDFSYQYAQEVAIDFLQELIKNIEKLFNKGLDI